MGFMYNYSVGVFNILVIKLFFNDSGNVRFLYL